MGIKTRGVVGIALNEFGPKGGAGEMIGKTKLLDREEDNCEQKTARMRSIRLFIAYL